MKHNPTFLTPIPRLSMQLDTSAPNTELDTEQTTEPGTFPGSGPASMQTEPAIDAHEGELRIQVTSAAGNRPIAGATILITSVGEPENILERLTTDDAGNTPPIMLPTPPLEYSLEQSAIQPYSEFTFRITASGYEPVIISGAEILPTVTAIQQVTLDPATSIPDTAEAFVIGPHTLYGDYPPKIIEDEIKPVSETGEIVLSRVVIPEYIVVHDGPPSDSSAMDYYVPYKDYIKNVASSEIYATWPQAAIYANVLAIQSFTLNRVYTEW